MTSLLAAPMGKTVKVAKIETEGAVKRRLEDLGVLVGQDVTPMSDTLGNTVLRVKDSRLVINHGLARKIFIH
jgi:ferrous iron transport protein A